MRGADLLFQVLLMNNEEFILKRRCHHRSNPQTSRRCVLGPSGTACMEINGVAPPPVESQGHVVCEQLQATGKNPRRCRICCCWLSVQVGHSGEPFRDKVFDVPFHRIFLPKDNQVLTLVLGGKSIGCALLSTSIIVTNEWSG